MTSELEINLADEAAQLAFGAVLVTALVAPCRVYLEGDLGAGKTTLVRGVLRAMGFKGAVRSPTYTLVEPYRLEDVTFYHLDLYRLADGEELEYLGFRDMLAEAALMFVEWPERAEGWLPPADLLIKIHHADEGRMLHFAGVSNTGKRIIEQISLQLNIR